MDFSQIPNISLKGIFTIHLVFTTWALCSYWIHIQSYMAYNTVLLLTLLWSIQNKDSEEPIHMAIHTNVISIFLDIFFMLTGFGDAYRLGDLFSFLICVIHFLLRFVSVYLLWRISMQRNSLVDPLPPSISNMFSQGGLGDRGTMGSPYEDIGGMPHQSVPGNTFGPSVYNT